MLHRKFVLALLPAAILSAQTPAPKTAPGTLAPKPVTTALSPAEVSPDKVVLVIGDAKYTVAQYQSLVMSLPDQYRAAALGPQKRQFIENYLRMKLLADEARKRNLQQKPDVQAQIAFASDNVLAGQAFTELTKNLQASDADVQKYYDQHKNEFETAKATHILIRYKGSPVPVRAGAKDLTEEEALAKAQELRKKLVAGGDFAATAKVESDDTGSAAAGGELGSFARGQMVGAFDQAAFSLPVGQISEPIKTQYGYHLIKVEERTAKTLDKAKEEIEQKLKPELARQAIENLKKTTPVTVDDTFFGPATPGSEK
jgi:peptidyl-prolyl cis-trans isomerase C